MKATGVVRKLDSLGRIVVPKEVRRTFQLNIKDPVEIFTHNDTIILKKYEPDMACMVTGEVRSENVSLYDGKIVVSTAGAKLLIKQLEKVVDK